ncbi:MAG: lipoprotein [Betaproteobacteria bacterium]|nr:lipoprotein [Betaproteobacteria bacterium]
MRLACLLALVAVALQGCGIKGPLYLPPPHAPAHKAVQQ